MRQKQKNTRKSRSSRGKALVKAPVSTYNKEDENEKQTEPRRRSGEERNGYPMKNQNNLEALHEKQGFICDMDGVLYHGNKLLDGAKEFVEWLYKEDKKFLFLTNASERSPLELSQKLARLGLEVSEDHFYTSALATARFLRHQAPGCSAYVIGAPGLFNALYDVGVTMNDVNPDYVIVGETTSYNYDMICRAVRYVQNGARLIATNSDMTGPSETGLIPACRALVAPIELATGKSAYFMGKPNPLMMRTGLKMLGLHSGDVAMIGDRMDTDVIVGMESGLDTVLVLSGCTTEGDLDAFPYKPTYVLSGIGDVPPHKTEKDG
jgi:NagD protein